MLIDDWRPKLYCEGIECDNISPNGNVFFIEEGHKYFHKDDIIDNKIVPFEESKFAFQSPTGIIKDLHEEFDTIPQAKKYIKKHKLPITWQQLAYSWEMLGDIASEEGTLLHAYGESLWNKWPMPGPDNIKTRYVERIHKRLSEKYILAKTELLVYSTTFRLAGQVDLLIKNEDSSEYIILDYKFLKKPLEMKSFYNRFTKKYKHMYGPFSKLMDCNYFHYSVQMEIYRYLMGKLGTKVVSKKLMVVTPEGPSLVEGYPIKIWISTEGILHARYNDWRKKVYDSSKDYDYLENPYRII